MREKRPLCPVPSPVVFLFSLKKIEMNLIPFFFFLYHRFIDSLGGIKKKQVRFGRFGLVGFFSFYVVWRKRERQEEEEKEEEEEGEEEEEQEDEREEVEEEADEDDE